MTVEDVITRWPQTADVFVQRNMACVGCHQMGQASTRTMPESLAHIEDARAAWANRIAAGQAGNNMTRIAGDLLNGVPYKYLAEWTDRIAANYGSRGKMFFHMTI